MISPRLATTVYPHGPLSASSSDEVPEYFYNSQGSFIVLVRVTKEIRCCNIHYLSAIRLRVYATAFIRRFPPHYASVCYSNDTLTLSIFLLGRLRLPGKCALSNYYNCAFLFDPGIGSILVGLPTGLRGNTLFLCFLSFLLTLPRKVRIRIFRFRKNLTHS